MDFDDLLVNGLRLLQETACALLNAEQMSMGQKHPHTAKLRQNAWLGYAGIVAVAWYAYDLHIRQRIGEVLRVRDMVTQMQYGIRHFLRHSIIHITDGAMRIRKNKNFQTNHLRAAMCIE